MPSPGFLDFGTLCPEVGKAALFALIFIGPFQKSFQLFAKSMAVVYLDCDASVVVQWLFCLGNIGRIKITLEHIVRNPRPYICNYGVWLVVGKTIVDRNLYVMILLINRDQCKAKITILLYINFAGECDLLFY